MNAVKELAGSGARRNTHNPIRPTPGPDCRLLAAGADVGERPNSSRAAQGAGRQNGDYRKSRSRRPGALEAPSTAPYQGAGAAMGGAAHGRAGSARRQDCCG